MPIVADQFDVVIGVDTHADSHYAAVLDRRGVLLAELAVTADAEGALALLALADQHTGPGGARLWAVEGTRDYGAGLCRVLTAADQRITEAPKPPARRRGGKSDALDAAHAARAVPGAQVHRLSTARAC
jgi:transposase